MILEKEHAADIRKGWQKRICTPPKRVGQLCNYSRRCRLVWLQWVYDTSQLADAIFKLYYTPEKQREEMGQRGRTYIKKYHSIPVLVDKLEAKEL